MTKILLCGFGSIGRKHARNIHDLAADLRIWRSRTGQAKEIESEGYVFEPSLEGGLDWCDAVVIATATDKHMEIALAAADAGRAIYLEKPLSHNEKGVAGLLKKAKNLVIEVGCQMRQHPNLKELKQRLETGEDGPVLAFQLWAGQRLDQWRQSDYRACYSADSARGGGALFDLVHEIDLAAWLVGSIQTVSADLRTNSDLDMNAEDLANLILVSKSGAAGTAQMDMLSPVWRRGGQVVCRDAVYRWDMKEGKLWREEAKGSTCMDKVGEDFEISSLLKKHMAHFLKRLKNKDIAAVCSLKDAAHDLSILLAARKAQETGMRAEVKS